MLSATAVSFSYGKRLVLDDVTLTLSPGKFVALLGTNGAGKSTLLNLLSGELQPASGKVTLVDKNLRDWTPQAMAQQRAVLPQAPSLGFNFSVRDVVMMGRTPHLTKGETLHDRTICDAALQRVDLLGFEDRPYLELSGGERQRVHLARVLAQVGKSTSDAPRYLLMDEPVSALDLAHQHSTLKIARDLTREGVGVLAILHDLNLALAYADEAILLHENKVLAHGPTAEVLTEARVAKVFGVKAIRTEHPDAPPFIQTFPKA